MHQWIDLEINKEEIYPTSRSFHTITKFENTLVLFGGITGETDQAEFLNDVWFKREEEKVWRNDLLLFSGTSNTPSPRCRHSAVGKEKQFGLGNELTKNKSFKIWYLCIWRWYGRTRFKFIFVTTD
jgi:hypothetical protein